MISLFFASSLDPQFLVHFKTDEEEGLYNLFFHNCLKQKSLVNLTVSCLRVVFFFFSFA